MAFTASASDPDGYIVDTFWTFGDGQTLDGVTSTSHTYNTPGVYNASFTATDDFGDSTMRTVQIQVTGPPPPPGQDVDGDGLADSVESQVGDLFTPYYHVSANERSGTAFGIMGDYTPETTTSLHGPVPPYSYYRVKPMGFYTDSSGTQIGVLRIDYLTLWNRDDGLPVSGGCEISMPIALGLAVISSSTRKCLKNSNNFTAAGERKHLSPIPVWRVDVQKIVFIMLLAGSLFATGCGNGGEQSFSNPSQPYQSLHVAPMMATVRTGATISFSGSANRFIAVGRRPDGSADFSWNLITPVGGVTWNSSNPAVASIDSRGHFTALSAGTTTISATLGTLTASTTLVVSDSAPMLVGVRIDPGAFRVENGGAIVITRYQAIAEYDDGSEMDISTDGVWISSDVTAITIDSAGWVTYKSKADCTILFLYGLSYNSLRITHLNLTS